MKEKTRRKPGGLSIKRVTNLKLFYLDLFGNSFFFGIFFLG